MSATDEPKPLFTVPIPATGPHPGGAVVATEPAPGVYLLTFTSPADNRLTKAFCAAVMTALDIVEFDGRYKPGVVVTTSGIPKFYSNGLDLEAATSDPNFLQESLWPLFKRFLTYPMPTIALMPGHAFAGGLMLAMHHDYRVMSPSKGYACVNELDFGVPLRPAMSGIFRAKLPPATYRSLVLEARRFPGPEALEAGIADALGGLGDAVLGELVGKRELTAKARTGIYGAMKAEMYRENVALLEGHEREEARVAAMGEREDERQEAGRRQVEEWKKAQKGAKL